MIMLTALSGDAYVRAAMEPGADDFLTAPLDHDQVAVVGRTQALRARVRELEPR